MQSVKGILYLMCKGEACWIFPVREIPEGTRCVHRGFPAIVGA